jgi:hypothetical protein
MADVFFASPTSSDVCQQTFVSLTSNHVRRQKTLNPVVRGKATIGGGGITVGSTPVDEKKKHKVDQVLMFLKHFVLCKSVTKIIQ